MPYRRILSLIAASLALDLSSAAAENFTRNAIAAAIDGALETNTVVACDPYVDVGCHLPAPKTPDGCTDCVPGQFNELMMREKTFVIPETLIINGNKIEILKAAEEGNFSSFGMPAQVGY